MAMQWLLSIRINRYAVAALVENAAAVVSASVATDGAAGATEADTEW